MSRIEGFGRRLAAYVTDCVVILVYAGVLAVVTLTLLPDPQLTRVHGYGLALVTLTLPVILGFSVFEASLKATPGKILFRLRVESSDRPANFSRYLLRNLLKFLPWELAHLGIWLTPGQPFVDAPGTVSLILIGISYALLLIQAGVVLATQRGLHDRFSGLQIVRRVA